MRTVGFLPPSFFFIPLFPTPPERVSTCHQVCSYGIHFPSITNTNHLLKTLSSVLCLIGFSYYHFLVVSLTVYSKLFWLHYSHLLAPHGWVSYSRTVYLHPGCPGSASETQCGRFLSNTTNSM